MGHKKYLDLFLEQRMNSVDGEEIKSKLEAAIDEEKKCLDSFKFQIDYCQKQIASINKIFASKGCSHDLMEKKRAFEEYKAILNVAAQIQECSYETKGIQEITLFREK